MAGLNQVLNMGGGGGVARAPLQAPTARPATPTGQPEPIFGQALAGMQPGGPEFAPEIQQMAQAMDGPETVQLFGHGMPSLSILDLMRLMKMRQSWSEGSEPYGAIL